MKAKRLIAALLACILLLCSLPITVGAETYGDFTYTTSGDGSATITGYTGTGGYITIPSYVNGYVVTAIGDSAFRNNTSINTIVIPSTIASIGSYAFGGCTGVTRISIPKSVTWIGRNAFENCTYVTELYFNAKNIESFTASGFIRPVFQNIGKYTSGTVVTFGPDVVTIPNYIFYNSSANVTKVLFEGNCIVSIGSSSFRDCSSLKQFGAIEGRIGIPSSVQSIGEYAFGGCTGVTEISIPESVTSIGRNAFENCFYVTKLYFNAKHIESFTVSGFIRPVFQNLGGYASGTTVFFGKEVTRIPNYMFNDSTKKINKLVFQGNRVTAIGQSAFKGCEALYSAIYCGTSSQWSNVTVQSYNESLTNVLEFHTSHNWGAQTVLKEPTCTRGGTFEHTCTKCEIMERGSLAALGHNVEDWTLTIDPLCETDGEKEGVCTRCSAEITQTIPALGHNYIGIVTTEPTCTQDGVKTFTCGHCGDVYTETVPSLGGHVYDNGTITKEVTCTEYGTMTFICQNCGEPRVEILPAFGHSYDSGVVTTAPTCETDGIKTFTCATCAHTYTETLPAFGHTETMVTADATCTEDGYTAAVCTTCGNELSRKVIPAFGHTEITEVVDATCTEDGYTSVVCEVCKAELLHEVHSALGHSYDSGVVTTAPTCETDGIKTFTCAVCAHTYTETLSALGHTETTVSTEANCTQNGYVVVICTTCGDELSREIIPAYGHSYGDGTVTTAPTCEEEGIETFVCTVCAYVDTEVVPATGHTEATVTVDATCTEDGYVLTVCEVCEKELARQPIATLGHQYVSGFCTVCGHQNFQYGDANDDGRINSSDITRLLRYLANRDPMTGESSVVIGYGADCNGDGKISSTDVTRLLRYLANRDPMTGESSIVLGPTN